MKEVLQNMTLESFDNHNLELGILYGELEKLGADIESIRRLDPSVQQLRDLLNGLSKLLHPHHSLD